MLEELPPTFTKDYVYGLGLARPYRAIVEAVEALSDCTEIVISGEHETGRMPGGVVFNIAERGF